MKLTNLQAQHYPTIKFFLEETCGLGKTELIAYAYLMTAIEHPGRKYHPIDFPNDHFRSQQAIIEVIYRQGREMGIDIHISKSDMTFWVEHSNPYLSREVIERIIQK